MIAYSQQNTIIANPEQKYQSPFYVSFIKSHLTVQFMTFSFFIILSKTLSYSQQAFITSIILSCCSAVILLSLGRHNPLVKTSIFISNQKGFERYICYICIGFQIGRPSALIDEIASRISVGQDFPGSFT